MMSAGTKAKNSPWTYVSQNLRWILMGRIVSIPTISTGHESCKNCWHAENKGWIDMKKIKKFVISQLSANMKIIIVIILHVIVIFILIIILLILILLLTSWSSSLSTSSSCSFGCSRFLRAFARIESETFLCNLTNTNLAAARKCLGNHSRERFEKEFDGERGLFLTQWAGPCAPLISHLFCA